MSDMNNSLITYSVSGSVEMISYDSKTNQKISQTIFLQINGYDDILRCYREDPSLNSNYDTLNSLNISEYSITMPKSGQNIVRTFALRNNRDQNIIYEFICQNSASKLQFMTSFDNRKKKIEAINLKSSGSAESAAAPFRQLIPRASIIETSKFNTAKPIAAPQNTSSYRLQGNRRLNTMPTQTRTRSPDIRLHSSMKDIDEDDNSSGEESSIDDETSFEDSPAKITSNLDEIIHPVAPTESIDSGKESSTNTDTALDSAALVLESLSLSQEAKKERSHRMYNEKITPMIDPSPITSNWGESLLNDSPRNSDLIVTPQRNSLPFNTSSSRNSSQAKGDLSRSYGSASQLLFASMDRDPELKRYARTVEESPLSLLSSPQSTPSSVTKPEIAAVTLKVLRRKVGGNTLGKHSIFPSLLCLNLALHSRSK